MLIVNFFWIRISIVFFLLSTCSAVIGQTTYYVSDAGSDASNGKSITTPFRSLDKVNGLSLQPGDSVLFRRGDTFRGTLLIRSSGLANHPLVFDAYGRGQKPVLAGSVPVTNWTNVSGNTWQASCPTCGSQVTGLYRNGTSLPLGRWPNPDAPNKGILRIGSHTGSSQIVSQQRLPDGVDWQGAEIVMRPTAWIIDRALVTQQNGDALTLLNQSNYAPTDNSTFFLQSHPATLDQNGEWYYNSTTKTFQVYSTSGDPNTQLVTATTLGRVVDLYNTRYVSLRNLTLTQSLNTSLYANDVSNLTLSGLDITNSGEDGVVITGSGSTILIDKTAILDANNNGLQIDAYQNFTLQNSAVRRIGAVAGRGKSGDGMYNGVKSGANLNVLLEHNTLDSIGYNGITFDNNTTIRQNVISNYCITKIDGGGVYSWNGGKNPMSNIHILSNILYTSPYVRGTKYESDYSIGVFLDDCVENVEVRGNTIFGNTQWGAFLHGNSKITFTDNTLFDNYTTQLMVYHNNGGCPTRNDVIKRNIIVSKEASQLVAQYESNANDLNLYGDIDSNYYARPFDETATIQGVKNSTQGGRFSVNDWKTFSGGLDTHSSGSPITYNTYTNEKAGGINRFSSTFDADASNWYILYSNYNNAAATQDKTKILDGGSLRVSFTSPSGKSNSYMQAVNRFGAITKGKTYVLRFDAIASAKITILVYLRTYGPPYTEYDKRYSVTLDTVRKSFELPFTASDSDPDAVMLFQMDGEGATYWLDNVRLQEGVSIRNNPDDFIKLFYNPTLKDSLITLTGAYRDVKNQSYTNSLVLKPFTSIILLRDTLPALPADLSLSLQSDKRVVPVNQVVRLQLRIKNQSNVQAKLARWTYRSPANMQVVDSNGQEYGDNVVTGTVQQLPPLSDTTFVFWVKPIAPGYFRTMAQITTATSPDPDSSPGSGTADGEDDTDVIDLVADGLTATKYESPNPNQRSLPAVVSNQIKLPVDQADLSLRIVVNSRTPSVGEIITYTIFIYNQGGGTADMVTIQDKLPDNFEFITTPNWSSSDHLLSTKMANIQPNTMVSTSFQARITAPGFWTNQAQIYSSTLVDPDSTPGNGFNNGEDDQGQIDVRTR